jgi:hypothetical protein
MPKPQPLPAIEAKKLGGSTRPSGETRCDWLRDLNLDFFEEDAARPTGLLAGAECGELGELDAGRQE